MAKTPKNSRDCKRKAATRKAVPPTPGAAAPSLLEFAAERRASFTACTTCRNEAARRGLRDAMQLAVASPDEYRDVPWLAIHAWLVATTGLEATEVALRGHAEKHESALYARWREVRGGR